MNTIRHIRRALFLVFIFAFFPLATCAQTPGSFRDFAALVINIINILIPLVFGLTFLMFLVGVSWYIFSPGNEDNIKKGRQIMMWGVVILFVMLSIWGLVNLLANSFFAEGASAPFNVSSWPG